MDETKNISQQIDPTRLAAITQLTDISNFPEANQIAFNYGLGAQLRDDETVQAWKNLGVDLVLYGVTRGLGRTSRAAKPTTKFEKHHSDPSFMGGLKKQP